MEMGWCDRCSDHGYLLLFSNDNPLFSHRSSHHLVAYQLYWHVRIIGGLTSFAFGLFATLVLDSARTFYEATFKTFGKVGES